LVFADTKQPKLEYRMPLVLKKQINMVMFLDTDVCKIFILENCNSSAGNSGILFLGHSE
jgi:hypothetical protein